MTEVGEVDIDVHRDRGGSFEPNIVKKRQRRLSGVDELVISLAAKGLTTGEIAAHFDDVYGTEISQDTISRIADRVLEEMTACQSRPLDRVAARPEPIAAGAIRDTRALRRSETSDSSIRRRDAGRRSAARSTGWAQFDGSYPGPVFASVEVEVDPGAERDPQPQRQRRALPRLRRPARPGRVGQ